MTNLGAQNSLMSLENKTGESPIMDKDADGGKQVGKSADKSHESNPHKVLLLSSKKNLDPLSHGESSARAHN